MSSRLSSRVVRVGLDELCSPRPDLVNAPDGVLTRGGVVCYGEQTNSEESPMPTRRIFELMIIVAIAVRPAFGLAHLWAVKALNTSDPGSVSHGTAEIVSVIV
jgi:hypothetical protein